MNIYEAYGRLQEQYNTENQTLLNCIALLADLQAGRIQLSQLELTATTWKVNPADGAPSVEIPTAVSERTKTIQVNGEQE